MIGQRGDTVFFILVEEGFAAGAVFRDHRLEINAGQATATVVGITYHGVVGEKLAWIMFSCHHAAGPHQHNAQH